MTRPALTLLASVLAVSGLGCDPGGRVPTRDSGASDGGGSLADADGDGISDADEGRVELRDTDADGTADYLDPDSDGDGIPDAIEAGDADPATPPRDADGDSRPDFIDLDSDENGIPDADETDGDADTDGTADFADLDDDNDGVRDAIELTTWGRATDTDGDGAPNYQDPDSDGDTISDGHERDVDTDRDGNLDAVDLDSDDDGLLDATEAGDPDVTTVPVDTDGDGIPDFRDPDSDNDGLSDGDEVLVHGTNPRAADSDGDDVSDLIEIGAGTDPLDMSDDPRSRGDFVFVVPYMEDPDPARDTLQFRTSIQFADVYFLFDRSGSMGAEIDALQSGVVSLLGNLTCGGAGTPCTGDAECVGGEVCSPFTSVCISDPSVSGCVPSLYSGVGWYLGTTVNRLSLQGDPAVTESVGLAFSEDPGGTESLYLAVTAITTGAGGTVTGCSTLMPGFRGCPAFRDEAVRMLVVFTDEDSDGGTLAAATAGLVDNDITLIGVWSGATGSTQRAALANLVSGSGSFRADGTTPLMYDADGSDAVGFVTALSTGIREIVNGVPLRVTIDATDEPDDAGDALQFIQELVTNTTTGAGCSDIATEDANPAGDGVQDTFPAVTPGTPVCWDVVPRRNETVMPAATPLVFRARLTVSGDGSPLDSRTVYFLVPPEIPDPGGPD